MAIELDHIILAVNERERSVEFYAKILGFAYEGEDGPFSMLRVSPQFVIQIAPLGTQGGEHLAFALTKPEFEDVFRRIVDADIPFGDRYDCVGNMRGPGEENGSRGIGRAIYFFDPDKHLLEIRHYEPA